MWEDINEPCDLIRETSFSVHKYLRFGHLWKIYENSLSNRLRKKGLDIRQQHAIKVHDDDGTLLGDFYADIFAENQLILEIKACKTLTPEHTAQLLGYLRATKIDYGLLINLGAPKLQIRKYTLSDTTF
jgi:GxxExxY protein